MRRHPRLWLLAGALCALLASPSPVRALPPPHEGSVTAPAPPNVARELYNRGLGLDGVFGSVFRIPASADNRDYVLTRTTSLPADLDAYFFTDDGGRIGMACTRQPEEGMLLVDAFAGVPERGPICPRSSEVVGWAIVVLFAGAPSGFTLSY